MGCIMQNRRTDLAVEASETTEAIAGIISENHNRDGFPVTLVSVTNHSAAEKLGKPVGKYVTLELGKLKRREQGAFRAAVYALAEELSELLRLNNGETVLVAGLGNRAISPDAIGPEAVQNIIVTNHLPPSGNYSRLRPVCAVEAGVPGTTGIESAALVRAVADSIKPDRVIVVDALASRRFTRVCTTVQLTDTGIIPGSGVGGSRAEISGKTLGVPVIAVGVPTVVDAGTLACDVLEQAGITDVPELSDFGGMMVTPRDIDESVADLSRLIGYAINLALHQELNIDDITMLLG